MNNFYEEHGILPNKEQFDLFQKSFSEILPNHPLSDLTKYKLGSGIFIESGSLYGDTIQRALDCGYTTVYSIEIDDGLYELVKGRFEEQIKDGTVKLYHGSTIDVLPNILKEIDEPVTFWLDAHLHNGDYGVVHNAPVVEELSIISEHHIKDHLIMVDDMRIIRNANWGRGNMEQTVLNSIRKINENYRITYRDGLSKDDILVTELEVYELWSLSYLDGEIMPLTLIERGYFDELLPKFIENKSSVITNKSGDFIKKHYNL